MYKFVLITLFLVLTACNPSGKDTLTISDAWIREAPPNAHMLAGYATITNHSDHALILTFAKSDQFNMVEIHKTIVEDGVAKMRRQDNLSIPPGKSLKLEPGSYHLMLMGPKSPLKTNDEVIITLGIKDSVNTQAKTKEMDIVMPVEKR